METQTGRKTRATRETSATETAAFPLLVKAEALIYISLFRLAPAFSLRGGKPVFAQTVKTKMSGSRGQFQPEPAKSSPKVAARTPSANQASLAPLSGLVVTCAPSQTCVKTLPSVRTVTANHAKACRNAARSSERRSPKTGLAVQPPTPVHSHSAQTGTRVRARPVACSPAAEPNDHVHPQSQIPNMHSTHIIPLCCEQALIQAWYVSALASWSLVHFLIPSVLSSAHFRKRAGGVARLETRKSGRDST
jgi:hypothetical protein